jgi:dTMP kinase
MAGVFITFEGIDGCGKSTQLRMLTGELRARRFEVATTREPGGTKLGQRLRAALLDVEEQVDPLAELLVFAADRAQHVRTVLRPALEKDEIVISDRYAMRRSRTRDTGEDSNRSSSNKSCDWRPRV